MSVFLSTTGNTSLAVGICGRCSRKVPYDELRPDGNVPGLRVCGDGCSDQFDPYRLPARQTENIALRFSRPDTPLYEGAAVSPPAPEPEIHPFVLIGDE